MIYNGSIKDYITQNYPLADASYLIEGKVFRFDIDNKGNNAGWAILFEDGNGIVGDWRTNEEVLCFPTSVNSVEQVNFKKRVNLMLDSIHKETYTKLADTYNNLPEADEELPYLKNKNVGAVQGLKSYGISVVIPGRNSEGEITTLQYILPDGTKQFAFGSRVSGSFFILGKPEEEMYVAEGYATAFSIYKASGKSTLVAFNAGNLSSATEEYLKAYPKTVLTIVADNDKPLEGHTMGIGEEKARKTGLSVILIPVEGMDANDYANAGYNLTELLLGSTIQDDLELVYDYNMEKDLSPTDWLIEQWIAKGCIHLLSGVPGSGKSSVVNDIFLSYSTGQEDWHGFKIDKKQGIGVYLSGEGYKGLVARRFLWTQFHENNPKGMFVFSKKLLPLDTEKGLAMTIRSLKKLNKPIDIIVIDTFRKAFSGDENSAGDTEIFLSNCKKLSEEFDDAAIIIVAHVGKKAGKDSKQMGPRGSSNLTAFADISISVTRDRSDSSITLKQEKTKDSEEIESFKLYMIAKEIEGKTDAFGKPLTSIIIQGENEAIKEFGSDKWKEGFTLFKKMWNGAISDGFPFISTAEFLDYFMKSNSIDKRSARNYLKESRNPFFILIQKGQMKREPEGFMLLDKNLAEELRTQSHKELSTLNNLQP